MGAELTKELKNESFFGIPKYKSFDGPVEKKPMDLQGITARVDKVNFDGVCRTKAEILQHCVRDLFTAKNFEDVIKKAHEAKAQMQAIGLFRSIAIYIDTSSGPNASRSGYEVTYQVSELKRFSGGVSKQFSNNEVFLAIGAVFPNIFGNGEILKGEYGSGTKRTNTLGVTFSKPFFQKWNPVGSFSLFCNGSEFPMSGYKVQNTGCLFDLALSMKRFKHNFQYELDWKHIMADKFASFDVIQDVGHKLKSCLRHVATYESRDSSIFPSTGLRFKITNEIAGLGGNIGLIKNEANFQYNCPFNNAVFQFALNAGHMFNFGREFCLAENFFLGGPQTLRAFQTRGVGPSKNGNFVGGNVYYAAGLHLYTPLPFKPGATGFGENFRTHLWLNAGNIGDCNEKRYQELTLLRMSAGFGIAVRLGQTAQLEFNICYPILSQKTDKTIAEHAQVGFGIEFL